MSDFLTSTEVRPFTDAKEASGLNNSYPRSADQHDIFPPHSRIPAGLQSSSRQSSYSIKSGQESLNDFLDLYADDDDGDDDDNSNPLDLDTKEDYGNETQKIHKGLQSDPKIDQSETNNILIENTSILNKRSNNCAPDQDINKDKLDEDCIEQQAHSGILQSNNEKQQLSVPENNLGFTQNISPLSFQNNTFKVVKHSVTSINPDATLTSSFADLTIDNSNIQNDDNNQSISKPNTYTYQFSSDDENDLDIDNSILQMINNLGQSMNPEEEVEIEFDDDFIDQFNKNKRIHSSSSTIDFLNIEMSSEDEDYDDNDRFRHFFELGAEMNTDDANQNQFENQYTNPNFQDIVEVTSENQSFQISAIPEVSENETDNDNDSDNDNDRDNEFDTNLHQQNEATIYDQVQDTNSSIELPDDPPPYSEFDQIINESHVSVIDSIVSQSTESTDIVPQVIQSPRKPKISIDSSVQSKNRKSLNSPLKRKISIKVKKNKDGELNRRTSIDYYYMDRYLPPYRSLINPNKVFDYRTNTYIDPNDNDIEIKNENNNPIVAIHKKKRDSKLMSIILTTNNNIEQGIKGVVNDTLSIHSRSISIKSFASITQNSNSDKKHVEKPFVPLYFFKDLPEKIVNKIICEVDTQSDLVNCLYVSKQFYEFAVPKLYEYPKFTSSYRLGQFVHTILLNENFKKYVKFFDLSQITTPINLTESEKAKYQDKLIYGSQASRDLLSDKTRNVYAGWRDWKFRNHPLYGDFNALRKRANSSSTVSSASSCNSQSKWESSVNLKNQSAPNLLDTKNAANLNIPINTRTRSYSGSNKYIKTTTSPSLKNNKQYNNKFKNNNLSINNTSSSKNNNHIYNNKGSNNGSDKHEENSAFIKSFKKAFGLETPKNVKAKRNTSPVRKQDNKSVKVTTKKDDLKKRNKFDKNIKRESEAFKETNIFTPHPMMNTLLKQYCFSRDIPVGYIIHILNECNELEGINFNNVNISTDYELQDYENFNWETGDGNLIYEGKSPKIIDQNKRIYWSDTSREMNFSDEKYAKIVEFKSVWRLIFNLGKIKVLKLRKISSLEQKNVEDFVMNSKFKDTLEYLDCSESGMVKRKEWNENKSVQEWREYFNRLNTPGL